MDVQTASTEPVPSGDDIRCWVAAALAGSAHTDDAELSVRLVDSIEMRTLNETFRDKQGTTNVLSFPAELPPEVDVPLLGDVVICAPVVRQEAVLQGKSHKAHWAHMTVHGTLHLLGYNHIKDEEAASMEALETAILTGLHFDNPYEPSLTGGQQPQ